MASCSVFRKRETNLTIEKTFGAAIRELRKAQKLSLEDVSFASGLDRSFISLLECGHQQPSLVTIFQLAKALQISATQLIASVEEHLQKK